jgi:CrcB protein
VVTAVLVVVCAGSGALARFLVDGLVQSRRIGEFPLGTFVVNISGCFVLGLLAGLRLAHDSSLVVGTAAVGSYTTFSTWMLESHRPAQDGESGLALLNVATSFVVGLGAVALGRVVGGWL